MVNRKLPGNYLQEKRENNLVKLNIAVIAFGTIVTLVVGCSNQEVVSGETDCPAVRAAMCTMQYDPVCGHLANGEFKTYSSDCVACSDFEVSGYKKGVCED